MTQAPAPLDAATLRALHPGLDDDKAAKAIALMSDVDALASKIEAAPASLLRDHALRNLQRVKTQLPGVLAMAERS